MNIATGLSVAWVCAAVAAAPASATTRYVDFAAGDNRADGLTPQTAWKHCPGDKQATDNPASVELAPGDTMVFKGGVRYFGEIELKASGADGNPITLDGNTAGTFGEGRAILDGGKLIDGWRRVDSAEEVQGNPRWKEILYADLDVDLSGNFNHGRFVKHRDAGAEAQAPWQRLLLIDGARRLLPIAQMPKPSDPFYPDLPGEFYASPHPLAGSYPHKVYYEEGTIGNRALPLLAITHGGAAPVIQPLNGGAVSVEMDQPATIAAIGITLFRPATFRPPEHIVLLADGREVLKVAPDGKDTKLQRFELPAPVQARKLTFRLLHSDPKAPAWTKLQRIAAFTPTGENVIEHNISSSIRDDERLVQKDPHYYDGMFIGVHGGNNHVYFAVVQQYDPETHRLFLPHFKDSTYPTTKYALYNAPRFLELPGEWCIRALDGGRTRIYLLPEALKDGQPVNIGYPVLKTAVALTPGASHIDIRGFLIQRYAGGAGGIATASGQARSSHLVIADCEVRFVSGQSGISLNFCDNVIVENCLIHHCPGWTVGIYVNRVSGFRLSRNRLDQNSGSGIRQYEAKQGVIQDNFILNHYGMHSSSLNFYEGCADIVLERNFLHNALAINRNAENLVIRDNVIDSQGRSPYCVGLWSTGTIGGTALKNIHIINNTFVNTEHGVGWSTAILGQRSGSPSSPQGLVIRSNILDRISEDLPGLIEDNLYTREVEARFMGPGCAVVPDLKTLFVDPDKGDYRRKEGGPAMGVGAFR